MKSFFKKALLFSLTLLVLVTSVAGTFSSPARAQCPAGADPNFCTDATAVCTIPTPPSPIANALFQGNVDTCIAVTYELTRVLFATEPPTPWYDPDPKSFAQKVFDKSNPDEIFGERYTYAQVRWILNSAITIMFPPIRAQNILDLMQMIVGLVQGINSAMNAFDLQASIINELPKYGFIGQSYFLMAKMPDFIFTDKIASGFDEVKYMAGKLNIASPAIAQGVGYEKLGIGTIHNFWLASRNISYLIAVIILVVAGFMIIFRTKISAQTSVTVQMVIPRLVISLVLVTFSYAIAGFVIDMMYVIITAVLGFLYFVQRLNLAGLNFFQDDASFRTAISQLTGDFRFVSHFLGWYIAIAIILMLLTIALAIAAAWVTLGAAAVVAPLMGIILGFFMWSVYLWAKILGQLIVAYLSLILLIIAGPIIIIFDILPTSQGGFKKWLLAVIGNASVFVSYAMISIVLFVLFDNTTGMSTGFINDPSGTNIRSGFDLPLFSGGYPRGRSPANIIQYMLFVGFMSMVPNIVNTIKGIFTKGPDVSNFIESTLKDTIGQFSSAGQKAGSDINTSLDDRERMLRGKDAVRWKPGIGTGDGPRAGGAST